MYSGQTRQKVYVRLLTLISFYLFCGQGKYVQVEKVTGTLVESSKSEVGRCNGYISHIRGLFVTYFLGIGDERRSGCPDHL